jgi:hypothetical protein
MLTTLVLALATVAPTPAVQPERVFQRASELVPWCRREAEAHFVGLGITTYQWTAAYRDEGNTLIVDGKLRADGRDVPVTCRIARGARERYAHIEIGKAP